MLLSAQPLPVLTRAAALCGLLACTGCSDVPDQVLPMQLFKDARPPVELAQGATVAEGDDLFMIVEPQKTVYVYVISEDVARARTVIYPCRNWGRSRPLPAGRPYRLPSGLFGQGTSWEVQPTSRERLLVLASAHPLDLLEPAVLASGNAQPCAVPVAAEVSRWIDGLIGGSGSGVWLSSFEMKGTAGHG